MASTSQSTPRPEPREDRKPAPEAKAPPAPDAPAVFPDWACI